MNKTKRPTPPRSELVAITNELERKQNEVFQLLNKQRIVLQEKVATAFEVGYGSDDSIAEEVITLLPVATLKQISRIIDRIEESKKEKL